MLITFKSKAAADVLMYEAHAKPLLDLLHKDIKRGVITAAETGGAVTKLEAEIASHKAHATTNEMERDVVAHHSETHDDHQHEERAPVSFATRAFPLLDMLREAYKGQFDVMWGV